MPTSRSVDDRRRRRHRPRTIAALPPNTRRSEHAQFDQMGRSRGRLRGARCVQEVRTSRRANDRYQPDDHHPDAIDQQRYQLELVAVVVDHGFFVTAVEQFAGHLDRTVGFFEHRHDHHAFRNAAHQSGFIQGQQRPEQQDPYDSPERREGVR